MPRLVKRSAASPSETETNRRVKFRSEVGSRRSSGVRSQSGWKSRDDASTSSQNDDEEDTPGSNAVKILSFHSSHQRVGAAFHEPATSTLSFLEDTDDSNMFDMSLAQQLEPTYIITGHGSHEKLIEAIIAYCEEHQGCQYQVRPSKDYKLNAALARLSSLHITRLGEAQGAGFERDLSAEAGDHSSQFGSGSGLTGAQRLQDLYKQDGDGDQSMRLALLRLGCFTSVQAQLSLCAAGALLVQLEKTRAARRMSNGATTMHNVECIKLSQHMLINADALTSLSIFDAQDHGSFSRRKESNGLSLFGAFIDQVAARREYSWDYFWITGLFSSSCRTRSGSALLKQWFQRPLCDIQDINDRQQCISVFHRSENRITTGQIRKLLKRIAGGVHKILNRLENLDPNDWKVWKDLVDFAFTAVMIHDSMSDLHEWNSALICKKIDFDSSQQEGKIVIHAGVDPKMDELIALLEDMWGYIYRLNGFASTYRLAIQFHDDEGYEYYKNVTMRQLDNSLGDLLGQQADLTVDITESLATDVRKMDAMLLEVDQVVAELDCILALTATCETFGLVRPRMVEENVLIIQKGRHILYEMANEAYIGNDTDLRHTTNLQEEPEDPTAKTSEQNLMLITGANGSGKSAYGKQVALIAYMAQIGSYVPAEAAILGVVDKLYTRIQTRESTSKVASAFMIDLSQVSMMLRGATARSLLVLDEFGKGTLPQDGAGLFIGTLEEFLSRGSDCPKIIAITHFQLERPREIADLQSSAAECALHYGVSAAIVERAKVVTEHVTRQEIAKIVDEVEISPSEALELLQAESLTRAFLKWDLSGEGDDLENTKKALEEMLETANRINHEA
ncbi:hypothetical protein QFC21_002810 [Naganishia friedmannii]|uniref:Uncharacterized protein n=1 Tax=Naganishia friedmannii TaxID=89922 RepID=A0ACC2VTI7_9TREE|nr:hypothetical protein QFC21_002810 [Naganishia friedmannii]